jgi:hypothetical protein
VNFLVSNGGWISCHQYDEVPGLGEVGFPLHTYRLMSGRVLDEVVQEEVVFDDRIVCFVAVKERGGAWIYETRWTPEMMAEALAPKKEISTE